MAMIFYSSFICKASISRFLYRCPQLRSDPKFISLLQHNLPISKEDVVAAVVDPFLHPSYTIRVMGCFSPISRMILERALVKLVSVWSFEIESEEDGEEIGEGDMHVIDYYVGRGRKLKLYELACLAFCRAVELDHYLLPLLLGYLQYAPPPFRRLLSLDKSISFTEKVGFSILDTVRVSYRLLYLNPTFFSKLWDWSTFLDLARLIKSLDMETTDEAFSYLPDIKWFVREILVYVLHSNDKVIVEIGMSEEAALRCFDRWKKFHQDASPDKIGWYLE